MFGFGQHWGFSLSTPRNNMPNQLNNSMGTVETIAGNLTSKIAYASAASTGFMGWVGSNQFAVLTGFIIALATFCVSWYYKREDNARRNERHKLAMEETKARIRHLENSTSNLIPLETEIDTVL